jgi:hypothetical protein
VSQKDVTGLVGKVEAAIEKLGASKEADAVQKLTEFQATLDALATAPKPKVLADAAQRLSSDAQGAIDCINAIGAA